MRKIPFLILLLFANTVMAQTPFVDSVRKELHKQKPDSMKVHDRIRVSWTLIRIPDSSATAWRMLNEIDSLANGSNNPVLKGLALEHRGYYNQVTHNKKAIEYFLESEQILKQYPQSEAALKSMITVQTAIAYELMLVHQYEESLNYNLSAMRRAEAFDKNHRNLGLLYGNIVNCYNNLFKYEAALAYCEKAYNRSKTAGPPDALFSACGNYGMTLFKLKRKQEAFKYLDEAKSIALTLDNPYMLLKYYQVVGSLEYEDKNYEQAYAFIKKAIEPIHRLNSPFEKNEIYIWMGLCAMRVGEYNIARAYQDSAVAIARQNNFDHFIKEAYDQKYLTERNAGNPQKAFEYLDSFFIWRDSLQ